jgi:hypothetical protein
MKFSLFDIMHWPGGTNPTDFDPQRAAEVYDSRMQEYIRAEQLGFDSVFFGEHHFTAYSITPSPNLLIAAKWLNAFINESLLMRKEPNEIASFRSQ